MCIYKLLSIINSNLLFSNLFLITLILYPILSILTLLAHQALLASLLGIIGNVNSYTSANCWGAKILEASWRAPGGLLAVLAGF